MGAGCFDWEARGAIDSLRKKNCFTFRLIQPAQYSWLEDFGNESWLFSSPLISVAINMNQVLAMNQRLNTLISYNLQLQLESLFYARDVLPFRNELVSSSTAHSRLHSAPLLLTTKPRTRMQATSSSQ